MKKVKSQKVKEENIFNVPNFFTTLRVIITFIIVYMVFADFELWIIAVFFVAGMITDAIDGNVARIFNMKTEFGRKYDMVADRFLFAATILSVLVHMVATGVLGNMQIIQIIFIMLREIAGLPYAVWAFFSGNLIPRAKVIGKITTVMQAVSFPAIVLKLWLAWPLAIATGVVGLFSGVRYAYDSVNEAKK